MQPEKLSPLLVLALMVAGCAASTAAAPGEPATPPAAAAKAERTNPATLVATGEPRRCIPTRSSVQTRPAGDAVLMFRTGSNSWFRNDLRGTCPAMARDLTLVFRSVSTQYCDIDQFEVVDPVSGMTFGTCALGAFTPVKVPRGTNF